MSAKNLDSNKRWRNITVAFHVSDEENAIINRLVALSGLTKQDYISKRLMHKEVLVYGNPKVYKALKAEMTRIYKELSRLTNAGEVSFELMEVLKVVVSIYKRMEKEGVDA